MYRRPNKFQFSDLPNMLLPDSPQNTTRPLPCSVIDNHLSHTTTATMAVLGQNLQQTINRFTDNTCFPYTLSAFGHTIIEPEPPDSVSVNLATKKKYKPVALKVRPVIGELPAKFRIIRHIIGNPLLGLPILPTQPPSFTPTGRYTQERRDLFDKLKPGFLWPVEQDLMHYFMMVHNDGFAWETSERGHFREDFFPPIDIPVVPHKPWVQRNIPIPPGLYDELCRLVKDKIDAGVF